MGVTSWIKKNQHIVFPVFDILLNAFNYIFHIYVSWYLISRDYGVLNSLLSISAILLVIGISFQTFTAKKLASGDDREKSLQEIFLTGRTVIFFLILLMTLLAIPFRNISHGSFLSIIILYIIIILNVYLSIFRGMFQGFKTFINLNISFYIEVGIKLFIIFVFLRYFKTIEFVMLSLLVGMLASLIHGYFKNFSHFSKEKNKSHLKKSVFRDLSAIFAANFFLYYFTSFDMIIVNYFLPEISGIYAVVLKYCQLFVFGTFSILTVFIPMLSHSREDSQKFNSLLKKCYLIIGSIGIFAVIFYYFIMPLTVPLFFNKIYYDASNYLFLGALVYFALVMSFVTINVFIVLEKHFFLYNLLFFCILLTILLNFFHSSITIVLTIELIVYSLLFVSMILTYLIKRRKKYAN